MTQLDINLCVYLLRLGLQPCRLGLHHRRHGDDTLAETKVGGTQVLVGTLATGDSHVQLLAGLGHMETALVDLQLDLLTSLVQFQGSNGRRSFGSTHLIGHIAPVPHGHANHYAHVPCAHKLLLETVVHAGVRSREATYQRHLRQVASLQDVGGLPTHIDDILQHLQLRTVLSSQRHTGLGQSLHSVQIVTLLVSQRHLFVDGQAAQLAKQHLRQHQSVVHLDQRHLGLVHLNGNAQSLRTGSHTLGNHLLHVLVQLLHQFQVGLSQFLLMAQRHHLPVGLVYII